MSQEHYKTLVTTKVSTSDKMNYPYFICLLLYINLGTIIIGYAIGVWNSGWVPYVTIEGIDDSDGSTDPKKNRQVICQSLTTGASAVGALFFGFIAGIGRWKCIMICSITTCISSGMTLKIFNQKGPIIRVNTGPIIRSM